MKILYFFGIFVFGQKKYATETFDGVCKATWGYILNDKRWDRFKKQSFVPNKFLPFEHQMCKVQILNQ